MYAWAALASAKVWNLAEGMLCRARKRLAKSLELSNCAAWRVGPKMGSLRARNVSTTPGRQRRFGADHGHGDLFAFGKSGERFQRRDRRVDEPGFPRRAGVARRHIDLLHAAAMQKAPRQGMLASTRADHQ